MRYGVSLLLLVILLAAGSPVMADDAVDIVEQKSELQRLERELNDSKQRLDSLQDAERDVNRRISELDERLDSDKQIIRRLTGELRQLQRDVAAADSAEAHRRDMLDRHRRRYLGDIRQFYMSAGRARPTPATGPNSERDLTRRVVYLTALAGYQSSNVAAATDLLEQSMAELEDVSGQQKLVTGLKRKRETNYALSASQRDQQERSLSQIRRESMSEADRVMMLQEAAEQMAELIGRLESQLAERPGLPSPDDDVFAGLKGLLPSPYSGQITDAFGEHRDPINGLRSFSPGITIKGRPGATVRSVAAGTVVHAGYLRGYGNFVIVRHDRRHYTTYAGLAEIRVAKDQYVQARAGLGTSANDGVVKFELRKGREPLDPVPWIDFESF